MWIIWACLEILLVFKIRQPKIYILFNSPKCWIGFLNNLESLNIFVIVLTTCHVLYFFGMSFNHILAKISWLAYFKSRIITHYDSWGLGDPVGILRSLPVKTFPRIIDNDCQQTSGSESLIWHDCWELNLVTLEEQWMLLIAEPLSWSHFLVVTILFAHLYFLAFKASATKPSLELAVNLQNP